MTDILAVDIETKCGRGCTDKCKCALNYKRNEITVIGVYGKDVKRVFRDIASFNDFICSLKKKKFLFHNGKFDMQSLIYQGADISYDDWVDDTFVMAVAFSKKIPEDYLFRYEAKRKVLNKELKSNIHRKAGGYSLKTLAPYHLDVEPFWEVENHNNDEYVLKDCIYTYHLYDVLKVKLEGDNTYKFYTDKLLNWTKMLCKAEYRGIQLDFKEMDRLSIRASSEAARLKKILDKDWSWIYKLMYRKNVINKAKDYVLKRDKALNKIYNNNNLNDMGRNTRIIKTKVRYLNMFHIAKGKIDKEVNLDSPTQLAYILGNILGYNIIDDDDKISTGKEVLKRLVIEGKEDVKNLLDYRGNKKLVTAFFPSYREKADNKGILNCSFNIGGTKTGRLSSNNPNLQQVPKSLRDIFIAREGYLLATYDESAIEPHIMAYLSEDRTLCNILIKGLDFHGDAAKQFMPDIIPRDADVKKDFGKERNIAKQADLSILYGSGAGMLQKTAIKHGFDWRIDECKAKIRRFKSRYKGLTDFKKNLDKLLEKGPITNIFGRKFEITDPDDIYMRGFNSLVQGSASDLVLNSAYEIQKEFESRGIDANVLLLVHDEIICEIPNGFEYVCREIIIDKMTNYKLLTEWGHIKLKVEGTIGRTWEK